MPAPGSLGLFSYDTRTDAEPLVLDELGCKEQCSAFGQSTQVWFALWRPRPWLPWLVLFIPCASRLRSDTLALFNGMGKEAYFMQPRFSFTLPA